MEVNMSGILFLRGQASSIKIKEGSAAVTWSPNNRAVIMGNKVSCINPYLDEPVEVVVPKGVTVYLQGLFPVVAIGSCPSTKFIIEVQEDQYIFVGQAENVLVSEPVPTSAVLQLSRDYHHWSITGNNTGRRSKIVITFTD